MLVHIDVSKNRNLLLIKVTRNMVAIQRCRAFYSLKTRISFLLANLPCE